MRVAPATVPSPHCPLTPALSPDCGEGEASGHLPIRCGEGGVVLLRVVARRGVFFSWRVRPLRPGWRLGRRRPFFILPAMKANAQFPEEESDSGEFQRQEDAFRAWVTDDGSSPY